MLWLSLALVTCSLTHSLTLSLTHEPTHLLIHSFVRSFIHCNGEHRYIEKVRVELVNKPMGHKWSPGHQTKIMASNVTRTWAPFDRVLRIILVHYLKHLGIRPKYSWISGHTFQRLDGFPTVAGIVAAPMVIRHRIFAVCPPKYF